MSRLTSYELYVLNSRLGSRGKALMMKKVPHTMNTMVEFARAGEGPVTLTRVELRELLKRVRDARDDQWRSYRACGPLDGVPVPDADADYIPGVDS